MRAVAPVLHRAALYRAALYRAALCCAAVYCAGCSQERGAPVVTGVTPSIVSSSSATAATLEGSNFHDFAQLSLDNDDPPRLDSEWSVRIGETAPVEGQRESSERIGFTVPSGLTPGVYDVTVIAPNDQTATLSDGLTVVDGPVDVTLSIETAGDGTGTAIPVTTLGIGDSIELFAVLRNGGTFVRAASGATWSADPIGTLAAGPAASTVFEALTAGSGQITAVDPAGSASVPITVLAEVVRQLRIDDAPGGAGAEVTDLSLVTGETRALYTVELDESGAFIADTSVTWAVSGDIGTLAAGPAASTVFEALSAGSGQITATGPAGSASVPVTVAEVVRQVRIDDAPGGVGAEVTDLSLVTGETLTVHAVELDEFGAFIADTPVTWTVTGGIGTLAAGPATSTSLQLTMEGTGRVVATSAIGRDETGDLTVALPINVTLISAAPGDGSRRASVFGHGDRLAVGPSDDGATIRLMDPDGGGSVRRSLSFFRDSNGDGTRSRNSSAAPYPSIGATGCVRDTPACGPDNENGRGLFGAGSFGGVDWMIAGGARSDDLDYIYMTPDDGVLEFRYVDLADFLGGSTESLTAFHVFGDDLYLGFSDSGGSRPFFVRVSTTPTAPGLDPMDMDAVNLEADQFPNIAPEGEAMLDTIWDFGNRIYTANAGSWIRATRVRPRSADSNPGDWVEITPTAPEFTAKVSFHTPESRDLESADRAVPYMATFRGRLYVARNTTTGPQLWVCDPSTSGSATHCDAADFSLVAPSTGGDLQLTNFDNPNNTAITLLAATSSYLYVGYDNAADGVVVFRTASASPREQADFEGDAACAAADHPAACDGLGGNGFGIPTNEVIFDAHSVTFGADEGVYLTTGDGSVPVSVYRLQP